MGIPSFYRQLCRRWPRIIANGVGSPSEWLCLDFNCAMYHVLRTMPAVATATSQTAWEADFCRAISGYMREIVMLANPTCGVYVSCDGVVCAAKRKQQRLRRFKGPWASAAEARVRREAGGSVGEAEGSGWDQNALTPGSAFMAQLGAHLTDAGKSLAASTGLTVVVSTTAEAGEGEHKLLRHMRSIKPRSCTVYGLDADLILLAMLMTVDTGASVRLLREAQEFERSAEGGWKTMDIGQLMTALLGNHDAGRTRDFVACMSLLGNDFLPRPLTRTVRDNGIPALISTLESAVWSHGLHVVGPDGALQRNGLLAVVRAWSQAEEGDMLNAALEAQKAATRPPGIADSPEETALRIWNSAPARWASLTRVLRGPHLRDDWRDIYKAWGPGSAADYCAGISWVWDYYSGQPVDQGWLYESHLPPLWTDVAAWLASSESPIVNAPPILHPEPLPEWLHLLSVLPAASVERLLPGRAGLVARAPWYWPSSWSFFDIGRTQLWECEPVIPVIPEVLLRSWIPIS